MIQKTMIALNGPPGIGKSWCAQRILGFLEGTSRRILGIKDFIWMEVQPRFNWTGTYAEFKDHIFQDGFTGREHMIDYADGKRAVDRDYWNRQLIESHVFGATDIVLHDSMRKWDEQEFFGKHISDFVTIVISPTRYSIGCLYDGDNGVCLPATGGFRAIDSNQAFERFKEFWQARLNANANSHIAVEGNATDSLRQHVEVGGLVGES